MLKLKNRYCKKIVIVIFVLNFILIGCAQVAVTSIVTSVTRHLSSYFFNKTILDEIWNTFLPTATEQELAQSKTEFAETVVRKIMLKNGFIKSIDDEKIRCPWKESPEECYNRIVENVEITVKLGFDPYSDGIMRVFKECREHILNTSGAQDLLGEIQARINCVSNNGYKEEMASIERYIEKA